MIGAPATDINEEIGSVVDSVQVGLNQSQLFATALDTLPLVYLCDNSSGL